VHCASWFPSGWDDPADIYLSLFLCAAALVGCGGFSFFVANAPNAFGSFRRSSDLSYGDDARQRLDVYAPRRPEHRPVVIFFYGGTWSAGRKSNYAFVGAALAERGYVTVIPDYRLYPEVRFPAFVEDGARAVAWVQQHARDFGADPDRLVLMGHSGHGYATGNLRCALYPRQLAAGALRRRYGTPDAAAARRRR
jgi:acetyl esterase/lipase